jgi:starch synthase
MVASEVLPFAKTGGLADVLSALPLALAQLGHRVTVVMPRYRGIDAGVPIDRFVVPLSGPALEAGIWEHPIAPNVRVVFIECPSLYDREALYGIDNDDYADNPRRFAFLARAALELAIRQADIPEIIHAHDWQCGLVPVYLKAHRTAYAALSETATIFTIHNLAYQGLCETRWLPELDVDWSLLTVDGLEYWGRASFLKGGVNFSELVTTVSPTYAREIQTPEYGFGFEGILARRSADLVGVLNGIDVDCWNPGRDPRLPRPYDEKTVSEGKRAAKLQLLQKYGISASEAALRRPLIGMISRLVDQKGLDIVTALGDQLGHLEAGFVVLGTGEARYQDFWTALASRYPGSVGVTIGFDEVLAHLIEAGADMFLMPSRFEPCGLNQMYSLRYGTVPIVRATGGLDDTVVDYQSGPHSTGFKFVEYSAGALRSVLERALALYRKSSSWKALQVRGMRQNFSWDRSAREYVKLYERALAGNRPATARSE